MVSHCPNCTSKFNQESSDTVFTCPSCDAQFSILQTREPKEKSLSRLKQIKSARSIEEFAEVIYPPMMDDIFIERKAKRENVLSQIHKFLHQKNVSPETIASQIFPEEWDATDGIFPKLRSAVVKWLVCQTSGIKTMPAMKRNDSFFINAVIGQNQTEVPSKNPVNKNFC